MKKVLIVFLIFAYLNCYVGCTTNKYFIVTGSEVPERLNQSNKYNLKIMTVDSVHYLLGAGMYRINNDTLIGMIQENNGKISNLAYIPIKNITRAESNISEVDAGRYDVQIMTVDSVQYVLGAGMYRFNKDTLTGMTQKNGKISNQVNIPVKNIARAEFDTVEFDAGKTTITFLAIAAGIAVVGGIVFIILLFANYEK